MARFRKPVTRRVAGTKSKHKHDTLHLLETARVKVNKARIRLPLEITTQDYLAVERSVRDLTEDLRSLVHTAHEAAAR